jgi:imidazolonepropionase-like amidohydrolase
VLYAEDPGMVEDRRLLLLNTPWDQTVLRGKLKSALGQSNGSALGPVRDNAQLLEGLRNEQATVASILNAGGVVLAGTDSPIDSVATAMHLNLRAQVKFGRQPWQALQTATLLPARAFGVSGDLGTLEAGKLADLVLVAGDPLRNIKDVANVRSVMKGGRLYSVADLTAPFEHGK